MGVSGTFLHVFTESIDSMTTVSQKLNDDAQVSPSFRGNYMYSTYRSRHQVFSYLQYLDYSYSCFKYPNASSNRAKSHTTVFQHDKQFTDLYMYVHCIICMHSKCKAIGFVCPSACHQHENHQISRSWHLSDL